MNNNKNGLLLLLEEEFLDGITYIFWWIVSLFGELKEIVEDGLDRSSFCWFRFLFLKDPVPGQLYRITHEYQFFNLVPYGPKRFAVGFSLKPYGVFKAPPIILQPSLILEKSKDQVLIFLRKDSHEIEYQSPEYARAKPIHEYVFWCPQLNKTLYSANVYSRQDKYDFLRNIELIDDGRGGGVNRDHEMAAEEEEVQTNDE
jgi:hypothetical protein